VHSLRSEIFVRRYRALVLRLVEHPSNGGIFNQPVDPVALRLEDYGKIVRKPMDLGTVRQRLEAGRYTSSEDLAADVRLTFGNAIRYNPSGHPVH